MCDFQKYPSYSEMLIPRTHSEWELLPDVLKLWRLHFGKQLSNSSVWWMLSHTWPVDLMWRFCPYGVFITAYMAYHCSRSDARWLPWSNSRPYSQWWFHGCWFVDRQAEMLQQRTELEVLLRQSLDDVKSEILRCLGGKSTSDLASKWDKHTMKANNALDMFARYD